MLVSGLILLWIGDKMKDYTLKEFVRIHVGNRPYDVYYKGRYINMRKVSDKMAEMMVDHWTYSGGDSVTIYLKEE